MNHILVTGAAGHIGSALVERLLSFPEYHVVAVDNLLSGRREKLPIEQLPNFTFIQADVNDYNQIRRVLTSYQFDYIFHYAAVVGVQRTLEKPLLVLNDIQGIRFMLDLSRETGVSRVFFSSSSEVYGEPVEFPQNAHSTPLNSRLPYAVVKNVSEAFLRSYHKEYGLSYTIFRFFNTYGPRQSDDFVITRFLKQALAGQPVTIYGDGSQIRTFCYIDDNIDVTVNCLRQNLCTNDVMNIGSDVEISVHGLALRIIDVLRSPSKLNFLPALKEGDMTRRLPDNSRMKEVLRRPLTTLDQGLKMTIDKRMF
ncbi:MAG TPA: NAD-dependent epimerase/dehydratase family protein [Cyclobacteriaceae bacterium]|nr:NAD-dependent epimerase/dehydratase family protein [Cyclobacteriaceae bacterium]